MRQVPGVPIRAGRPEGRRLGPGLGVLVLALAGSLGGMVLVAPPAAAIATGIVAFYSMDESLGSTVLTDSSGGGRYGTIGSEVTSGVLFDGATAQRFATHLPSEQTEIPGHVDLVPNTTAFNPDAGDFSFTIRYRTTFSFGNIVQKGQGTATGGYWKFEAPGGIPTCLFRGGNGASRTGYSSTSIADGQWHTVTCNRTSTYVEMYVDGVRTSTLTGSTGTIANSWALSIGGKSDCDGLITTCDYFAGDIDYLKILKGTGSSTNQLPDAVITANCAGLLCALSGAGSTDADGAIQNYAWEFGDGQVLDAGSVKTTSHAYVSAGSYTVRLTVTDDRGGVDTTTRQVTVAPIPEKLSFVGQSTANANAVTQAVVVPSAVQAGDTLLMFLSTNTHATTGAPAGVVGWNQLDRVDGGYATTTVWSKTAAAGDAGTTVRIGLSGQSKGNFVVAAYRGVDSSQPVTAFARASDPASSAIRITPSATVSAVQSWGVSYWVHGDATSTLLTPPSSVTVRSNSSQTGGGRVTGLLADSSASLPTGSYGGLAATGAAASTTTTTWTVVLQPQQAGNVPPQAQLAVSCTGLTCINSAAGSTDPDGSIANYAFAFGDGTSSNGTSSSRTRTYSTAGTYTVTLTVTDNRGAAASATRTVTVAAIPDAITYVGQATANANATTHLVDIPGAVQPGDALLLFFSEAALSTVPAPSGVTGWSQVSSIDGGSARTVVWRKIAGASDADSTVLITLSAQTKANLVIVAYRGVSATAPVLGFSRTGTTASSATRTTPLAANATGGVWALSYWAHRDSSTDTLIPPAGVQVRSNSSQTGGGRVATLLADSGGQVPPQPYGGLAATAASLSTSATMWTLLLAPED